MLNKDLDSLPPGYMTLYDLSRRKGYDLCGLVRAADLGDIETYLVTLRTRPRRGRQPDPVQARIVRADTIAPTYVARVKFTKRDDPKERFRGLSIKSFAKELGTSTTAVRSYLIELGLSIDDVGDDGAFEETLVRLRGVQEARREKMEARKKPRRVKREPVPEGYLTISEAAKKWGISDSTIYDWVIGGKVEHVKVIGRLCVKDGEIPRRPWVREKGPQAGPS